MAVPDTRSEAVLIRSIRKYFIDNLVTIEKFSLDFDFSYTEPPADKWVVITYGDMDLDTLAKMTVTFHLFVKKDPSGIILANLRDSVVNYLEDETMTDGRRRMPLYDSDWDIVGYAVFLIDYEHGKARAENGSMYKWLTVSLNWGA